jgi:hypothetical protein
MRNRKQPPAAAVLFYCVAVAVAVRSRLSYPTVIKKIMDNINNNINDERDAQFPQEVIVLRPIQEQREIAAPEMAEAGDPNDDQGDSDDSDGDEEDDDEDQEEEEDGFVEGGIADEELGARNANQADIVRC